MKVLETAVGAVSASTRFSLARISSWDLVADGMSLVRNSGVGGGGQNLVLIFSAGSIHDVMWSFWIISSQIRGSNLQIFLFTLGDGRWLPIFQEPKRTHKAKTSQCEHQRIFWTIRGGYRSLPSKTGVLMQIAPESSPERSAKSLSHSFFVVK